MLSVTTAAPGAEGRCALAYCSVANGHCELPVESGSSTPFGARKRSREGRKPQLVPFGPTGASEPWMMIVLLKS